MASSGVKVPLKKSFFRYNLSALTASIADISMLSFLHYILGIYYPVATAIAAAVGGCIAFFLGRNWTYNNRTSKITHQGIKFILVVLVSITLNTAGVATMVEIAGVSNVILSKIIVACMIGLFFNFPMQRFFVYR